jgi:RimJ/RimL family protein N-acetyltransferase
LEPYSASNAAEFALLYSQRELNAAMGAGGASRSSEISPPMLIRDLGSGEAVGVVENHPLPGRIAVFVIYLDRQRGRAGFGVEVFLLYMSHLFDSGARLVTGEVLEFNAVTMGIMRKAGLAPKARLREHVYSAGRFWDLLIYSIDREQWVRIVQRYRRILPGGDRRPAAIGGKPVGG